MRLLYQEVGFTLVSLTTPQHILLNRSLDTRSFPGFLEDASIYLNVFVCSRLMSMEVQSRLATR